MTLTQFRRMKVFAIRMARTHSNRPLRKRILLHVLEILWHMDCEDYSLHYSQIINWEKSQDYTPEEIVADPSRRWYKKNRLLCDWVNYEYGEYDSELTRQKPDKNGDTGTVLRNEVSCCIRAAIDTATSSTAGVWGWTLGDLRSMWKNRKLPKWVTSLYQDDLSPLPDQTPLWL